jgi:hypothetical protein
MKAWMIEYKTPEHCYALDSACVFAPTLIAAVKKAMRKLHLGPYRIRNVREVSCDEVIVK